MSGERKRYNCLSCPYSRHKDGRTIFCDVCLQKILDGTRRGKEDGDGAGKRKKNRPL